MLKFKCDDCGYSWIGKAEDDADYNEKYDEGHNCPKCESTNIGGEEIK